MGSRFQKFHHGTKNKTSDSLHVDHVVAKIEALAGVTKVVRTHTMKRRRKYSVGQIEIAMYAQDNTVKCLVHHNHGNTTLFVYFSDTTFDQMVDRIMEEFPDTIYPDKRKISHMSLLHPPISVDFAELSSTIAKDGIRRRPTITKGSVVPMTKIEGESLYGTLISLSKSEDEKVDEKTETEINVEQVPAQPLVPKPAKAPKLSKKKKKKVETVMKEVVRDDTVIPEAQPKTENAQVIDVKEASRKHIRHAVLVASSFLRQKAIDTGQMHLADIGDVIEAIGYIIIDGPDDTNDRHVRDLNRRLHDCTNGGFAMLRVDDLEELANIAIESEDYQAARLLAIATQNPKLLNLPGIKSHNV